ncbi:MAG: hypothetical protein Q7T86_01665 [Hyphomicrobiaceae bacterium]|nr:hypothetical protein [Hyphomicrobiaceae bacterium]
MSFRTNVAGAISWAGEPWSKSLAYAAFNELVDAQSYVPFFTSIVGNALPCWVVPDIDADGHAVTVYALYGPKKRVIDPRMLIAPDVEELAADWRLYGKALVIASYDETSLVPFQCIGHNGTTRGAREVNIRERLGLARFHEFKDGMRRYLRRYREDRGIAHAHPRVDLNYVHELQQPC